MGIMNDVPNQTAALPESSRTGDDFPVDPTDLTGFACWSLGRADLSIHDWRVQPLHYTVRNRISAGLYRIRGSAGTDEEKHLPWSVVIKVVQPLMGDACCDAGHWNYWEREALAYQSGLLERLTVGQESERPGLAVPRCWKVEVKADGRRWLWLEDVAEAGSQRWSLERYGLAAQHFGLFQGRFLQARPLPSDPWLSRGWMRARVASFADSMRHLHDPSLWDQPMVQRTCARSLEGRLADLWDARHALLDALDRLPQTLGHREPGPG